MSEASVEYIDYSLPENDRRGLDRGAESVGFLNDRRFAPDVDPQNVFPLHGDARFLHLALAEHDRGSSALQLTYYVGITAVGSNVLDKKSYLHADAGRLRAKVYIDEMGFLGDERRQADGTEADADDTRSIHVAAARVNGVDPVAVIGTMRLIGKRADDDMLPVEKLFDIPQAPVGSVEVSRFIARHTDRRVQAVTSLAMMRTASFLALHTQAPYVFAVIEEPLFRRFRMIGLPFEEIAARQWIEEYQSDNLAVRLQPEDIIPALQRRDERRSESSAVAPFFQKAIGSVGLGYFGEEF